MDDFGLGYSGDWLDDVPEDESEIIIPKEVDELDGFHIEILDDPEDEWDAWDKEFFDDEEGPESVAEPEGY